MSKNSHEAILADSLEDKIPGNPAQLYCQSCGLPMRLKRSYKIGHYSRTTGKPIVNHFAKFRCPKWYHFREVIKLHLSSDGWRIDSESWGRR